MRVDMPKKKATERDRGLHRRQWLREAAAGILGASAARALVAGGLLLPLIDTAEGLAEPLRQPSELVGPLIATPGTGAVWSGRSSSLLTFGGTYPSPTLRARRGATFELLLQNRLT